MKAAIVIPLVLFSQSIIAQRHVTYQIEANIKNFQKGEKVYFLHFNKNREVDSAVITDGHFSFSGAAEISNEPEENYRQSAARLFIDHQGKGINLNVVNPRANWDMLTVYLEQGTTKIAIKDSAYNAVIVPPVPNQGHYVLDSIYGALFIKNNAAIRRADKLFHNNNNLFLRYTDEQSRLFKDEQKKDMYQFVRNHPTSAVSLYILQHTEEFYPTYNLLMPYFEPLSPELKQTKFGQAYAAMLNTLKLVGVGSQAPAFKMADTTGKQVKLSSFKGKYVLIDFWASWCGPCRRENPNTVKAYQAFKNKNFTILGVSLDSKKDQWLKAIHDDHLEWTQVSDLQQWNNVVAKQYLVSAIPQNFLVDPQGKIIGYNLFGEDLMSKLNNILQ